MNDYLKRMIAFRGNIWSGPRCYLSTRVCHANDNTNSSRNAAHCII